MNGVELVVSYFTPTVFFCILNLMIATIFILNSQRKQPKLTTEEHLNPPQLVRLPSLFERVKSFNLSKYHSDPKPDPIHTEEPAHEYDSEEISHVTRSNSDTVVKKLQPKAKVLRKSASEKLATTTTAAMEAEEVVEQQRPATVREKTTASGGEDEAVDAKADDFINRFRQQLKLQRLDSILRYKEMLNRGVGR